MFALAWFGMVLWLIYGLYLGSAALIICNGMTLFLSGFIILYKLRYG
jgi:MtN3 and saliva related transmembrane protein